MCDSVKKGTCCGPNKGIGSYKKLYLKLLKKGTTLTYNSKQFNYYFLGLNVFEVAHDNCSSDLNIVNSLYMAW